MIAHILCPGPSLAISARCLQFAPRLCSEMVIAVNRGANFMDHDWLVMGDRHGFTWRLPSGAWAVSRTPRAGVVTFADARRGLLARDNPDEARWWGLDTWQWEDLPQPGVPVQWSVQAALLFAVQRGAHLIRLYGCDHRGAADYDGHVSDGRDDDRWKREGDDLAATVGYLRAVHQTIIDRITP